MKLIQNHGNDRVIDELKNCLADNSRLDLATCTFLLIAFGEMRKLLDRLKDCRIYDVLNHTDLSRDGGMLGDIDLSHVNWGNTAKKAIKDLFGGIKFSTRQNKFHYSSVWSRLAPNINFELLLKLGLDLCVPIETRILNHEPHEPHEKGKKQGSETPANPSSESFRVFRVFRGSKSDAPRGSHTIHSIGGGSLLVCLSPAIPQADVEPLALGLVAWHKELKPAGETTVVFRDSVFADDVAKTNLTAILQQHGMENVRCL